ncbi:hypothetical protein Kisp01_50270 [Kineosporia sp. NBRC 101677]|uniref:hypothetical protein n=1 Tax=Kineosporia sp. NBRC 101677 TaxID=3032197 RepID=UPI0024A37E39|nr:hypothetical protein [Kineosporia sp. NBRC 101677]GLY18013.1 hypothetical protein Kisp01_50270 [Kineosporia sp. NBRC 101677]
MTWKRRRCWLLDCDRCRDGWSAYEDEPHLETREALQKYAESQGWVFTGDRALCSDCVKVETCALTGHVWGRWGLLTKVERIGEEPELTWSRYCKVCTTGEFDPPLKKR